MTDQTYQVRFNPQAKKQLSKLDRQNQRRVLAAANLLKSNPRPPKSKKLIDRDDLWRVRVGDYRIIYQVEDEVLTVLVVTVGHRREVYKL